MKRTLAQDVRARRLRAGLSQVELVVRLGVSHVKLDFRGEWESFPGPDEFRPVRRRAQLLVVSEAPMGTLVTHWASCAAGPTHPTPSGRPTGVRVPREENIVYIPERCVKRQQGDHTTCGR